MNEKLEKQSKIVPLVESGLETPLPLDPSTQAVGTPLPLDPPTRAVGARALPVAQVVAAIPGPKPQLVVAASPGPLGVHFKAGTAEIAELSPGSQLAGEVEIGDVLESVNGRPATAASLAARRGVLEENDDGETPRTLVFARPDRRFAVHAAPGSLGVVFAPGTTRVGRAPERGSVLGPARSQLFGFVDEGDALLSVNGRPAAAASPAEGGVLDEEDDGARARLLVFERGPKQRNELSPNVEFVVRAKPGPLGVVFKNRPIFGNGRCVDSVSSRSQLLNRVACWDELAFVNGKPATEESLAAARGILEEEDDGRTERVLVFRCLRATGAGPGLRGTAPPEGSGRLARRGDQSLFLGAPKPIPVSRGEDATMAATEDAAALTTNVDALEAAAAAPLPDESQIEASAEKSPPRSPRSRKADGDKPAPKPRRENGLRRGKWTVEEEAYANRLIHEFKLGLLPLTDGTTLRTFLSKLLNCDPMRISKKFVGSNCIGKQVFRRRQADMDRLTPDDIKRSRYELAELERRFLTRVAQSHRSAKSGGAGAKGVKGGDGKALGGGLMQAQQRPMLAPWLLPPPHAAAGAPTSAGAGAPSPSPRPTACPHGRRRAQQQPQRAAQQQQRAKQPPAAPAANGAAAAAGAAAAQPAAAAPPRAAPAQPAAAARRRNPPRRRRPPRAGRRRAGGAARAHRVAAAVAALASPHGRTRELTPEPEEPTAKRRSEPSAKRERPPHVSSSDEDSNGGAGAAEDLDPTTLEQQRKDVRRERNRQHARVSRERKRQKLEHLQEENDALRRQEAALMDQRDRINARLLRVEYENRALRAWIQNHAGDGAPPPPPAADDDEASRPVPDH
ncbi:hypothetical protein SO694_00047049 [Aureococcus anophagefferens]|uniref:BZIP domain-containing protein n=1 Tax=Aureococcus anophagefferens TaxID=44056 RepID=A0ABR1G7I5_AURAN